VQAPPQPLRPGGRGGGAGAARGDAETRLRCGGLGATRPCALPGSVAAGADTLPALETPLAFS